MLSKLCIKKIPIIFIALLIVLSGNVSAGGGQEKKPEETVQTAPDSSVNAKEETKVAATVNGTVITEDELQRAIAGYVIQAAQQGQYIDESQAASIRQFMLDNLISREILIQEAERSQTNVPQEEIDTQMQAIRNQFLSQEEFTTALESQGFTEDSLRSELGKESLLQTFFETKIYNDITVSETEEKDFYDQNPQFFTTPEQVQASHILVLLEAEEDD